MSNYNEAAFESAIEMYLTEHDTYIKRDYTQFDRKLCLDRLNICKLVKKFNSKLDFFFIQDDNKDNSTRHASDSSGPGRVFFFINKMKIRRSA